MTRSFKAIYAADVWSKFEVEYSALSPDLNSAFKTSLFDLDLVAEWAH